MNRYKWMMMGVVALFVGVMASCAPEPIYSEKPVYDKIVLTSVNAPEGSNVIYPGDSVVARVDVRYPGEYITRAIYTWEITQGPKLIKKEAVKVVGPVGKTPEWSFSAPNEAGSYDIVFQAEYKFSAQTEDGTIYGTSRKVRKSLYVSDRE